MVSDFYDLNQSATSLISLCTAKGIKLTTAESCTGGLISSLITEISGASAVFGCGFITYSNQSKIDLLGVSQKTIEEFGAVSEPVAIEMAKGVLKKSQANISIAVTGIAGPTGATAQKPVGLVYIAVASRKEGEINVYFEKNIFTGSRQDVRSSSVNQAINMLYKAAQAY